MNYEFEDYILAVDGQRGVFVPRVFCQKFETYLKEANQEDITLLMGDIIQNGYWETWDKFLQETILVDDNGKSFYIYQDDGDVWLAPV